MFKLQFASPRELKKAGILGINARNSHYIARYNKRELFPLVDNKLITKKLALQHNINVPHLIGEIQSQHDIQLLESITANHQEFVIKPAQGSGGKGIMVITQHHDHQFTKASGENISFSRLQQYLSNLIGGLFSLGGKNDIAMIEQRIHFDERLTQYSYRGIPDIRIVVFKGYPVMAMMRCATKESDGKANLHQGAVGVGINLGDGRASHAICKGEVVTQHPDFGIDLSTIQVPEWQSVLELAASCYEMVGLPYIGADIIIDQDHKPMLLELNARPGLGIQVANRQGLKPRLNTIERHANPTAPADVRVKQSRHWFDRRI